MPRHFSPLGVYITCVCNNKTPKDEDLFKEPPQRDECDICMLTLPIDTAEQKYQPCCGKVVCQGCIHAAYTADNRRLCPFCRTAEATSDAEWIERMEKRAKGNDARAIRNLGGYYYDGDLGLQQDHNKAMELYLRAGELGDADSYFNIGIAYAHGEDVERDEKKAKYYYELAAMGGVLEARHNIGVLEAQAGNINRAMKHLMIEARAGHDLLFGKI